MDNNLAGTTIKNNEQVIVNTTTTQATAPANNETIDIRDILLKYLSKWYWFVISVVLCFAIAFVYLKITNIQYQVQTTILLRQEQSATSGLVDLAMLEGLGMSGATSKEVEDEIQVLTSKSIMHNVITSLGIETEYFVRRGLRFEEMYPVYPIKLIVPENFNDTLKQQVTLRLKRTTDGYQINFKFGEQTAHYDIKTIDAPFTTAVGVLKLQQIKPIKVGDSYKIVSYPMRSLTERFCTSIKVASVNKKSNAINISTTSTNFKKSEVVLNKLIQLYNLDAVIDKNMIASNTASFVEDRLKLIGAELLDVELNVENFKKQNSLTDISSEAALFLQSSSEYNKKLAELETQINLVTYIETYVKDSKNQYNLVPANLGIEDNSLLSLMQEYNKALLERMKLMRTTNDKNPVIMQMEQQLKELRSSVIASINSIKDGLKISRKDVIGSNSQFSSKIKDVPTQERKYLEIQRQQEIKQKLYLFLLQKREENALSLASTIPSAKTLDSAYTSITPVSPKKMIVFLLAFMLGLIIPIVIIYTLDMLNNKISNRKELKKLIKVPFLGCIGINKDSDDVVVVKEGSTLPIVEMFRIVRTNMQFMLGGKKSPVILVTSSISGEGKSFNAINIAMTFALMQKKVVLVGLDIRSPMVAEYLHLSKEKGVTMYISDPSLTVNDIIVNSNLHKFLDVIPAGPVPPNPAELIMSQRLDDLFQQLRNKYDYIIIDSAPIGVVSDTYLLNRFVDNCIFVTRQNYTPRDACSLINEIHDTKKLNNMAVILNGTDQNTGYGYGYGYGYGKRSQRNSQIIEKINKINKLRSR
jgi:capsular exopolysaccharide synthesis family protein